MREFEVQGGAVLCLMIVIEDSSEIALLAGEDGRMCI